MDRSQQAIEVFNRRASDYAARYMDISLYHETLDIFCGGLKAGASVLELACGPGNITRYILDKRPDLKVSATDLAPNMIAIAARNNPEAHFFLMDMRAIHAEIGRYDAVICGFGLPYLSRPETIAMIGRFPQILNSRGLVYLSTMEGSYDDSALQKSSDGTDEIFIHYYQADYLAGTLESAGFEIVMQKRQDFPDNNNTTDLIIIARWNRK